MKKKFITVATSLIMIVCASFMVFGCNTNEKAPQHTHSYTVWQFDDAQHWKKCADDDAISEKSDHNFVDGTCECGKKQVSEHTHSYTVWLFDDAQHWKKCADDDAISEKSDHNFVDGTCECGKILYTIKMVSALETSLYPPLKLDRNAKDRDDLSTGALDVLTGPTEQDRICMKAGTSNYYFSTDKAGEIVFAFEYQARPSSAQRSVGIWIDDLKFSQILTQSDEWQWLIITMNVSEGEHLIKIGTADSFDDSAVKACEIKTIRLFSQLKIESSSSIVSVAYRKILSTKNLPTVKKNLL